MALHLGKTFLVSRKLACMTGNLKMNFVNLNAKRLLVVTFALLAHIACHSATITFQKATGTNDDRISISGEIMKGDEQKFKEIALQSNNAIVYLDGPGGDLGAAIKIGRLVNALGYMTAVNESQCASACGLIWLSGHFKFLSPNAEVGFHLPAYSVGSNNESRNIFTTYLLYGAYLANLGFAEPFIAYMMEASNDQIKWLRRENAKLFGVNTFNLSP
jgi:hypothetical protein